MEAWLDGLTQGIDLDAPDASLQLFLRLMGLIDWWLLLWLTLLCIAVGGLIGWRRGTFWRDIGLAAALGPLGWVMSFVLPLPTRPCPRCGKPNPVKRARCAHCAASLAFPAKTQTARQPK